MENNAQNWQAFPTPNQYAMSGSSNTMWLDGIYVESFCKWPNKTGPQIYYKILGLPQCRTQTKRLPMAINVTMMLTRFRVWKSDKIIKQHSDDGKNDDAETGNSETSQIERS